MNTILRYQIDKFIAVNRRRIKNRLPLFLQHYINEHKRKHNYNYLPVNHPIYPWMSPNIWEEITKYYHSVDHPTIVEYGTGASTLWHLDNLIVMGGGQYMGIEKDSDWFWSLVGAVSVRGIKNIERMVITNFPKGNEQEGIDVQFSIDNVKVLLRLRTEKDGYITAFDMKADVVVIDGAYRTLCVQHALNCGYLKPGGLLMLMEAGRGNKSWWEGRLSGENDYSEVVNNLLNAGGILLDGNGVDNWPGCSRRSPKPSSYWSPMEALKFIQPKNHD